MTTTYRTIDDLWTAIVKKILDDGDEIDARLGYRVKEVLSYGATLSSIDQTFLLNKRRRLSPAYACAEFLWYLSMTDDIEMIQAYAPQYHKFAENGVAFGAYGDRWKNDVEGVKNQIELLIEHLQRDPASRQAVVTMWNANDLPHAIAKDHADLPCTLGLQFLIRNNKLHLVTTMRSNDAWLGTPYDVFAFTCLQWLVASVLNVEPGSYTHQVGSMHLYEKNWTAAREALELRHKYSGYYRLEHEWTQTLLYATEPHVWQNDVRRAVNSEQEARESRSVTFMPVNAMLYDAVACCSTKWGRSLIPGSPVLKEALKNFNNKEE